MITPQIEQFWNAQDKLLDEAEAFSRHWFQRRHEAARTALEVARETTSGDSVEPAKAMQTLAEWQRHSIERMVEDAREWFDVVSRCAQHVSETEADAVEKTAEAVTKVARKTKSTAKSEPV
ncbi:hypothetical protein [Ruegeria jejuensis]|uniref:hypothetical protein n=1 Tax=Ruegeria jejuensis TaxID=3233338 RepID=UPI00355BB143